MTEIRELREDELEFLRAMLYAALARRSDVQLPSVEIAADDENGRMVRELA